MVKPITYDTIIRNIYDYNQTMFDENEKLWFNCANVPADFTDIFVADARCKVESKNIAIRIVSGDGEWVNYHTIEQIKTMIASLQHLVADIEANEGK